MSTSAVEHYLDELERTLVVRGRRRRRLLAECRDHLTQSSAVHGPDEAVRRFGAAADLALAFDTEVAVRRGLVATVVTAVAVLSVAGSTLAVVQGADPGASAQVAWAVVFFAGAQTSAVSLALAALRAGAMRRAHGSAAEVAVLFRRNVVAVGFALLTLFAAAAAVPGHTTAWLVLTGPVIAVVAATALARTRSLARRLDPARSLEVRAPLVDAATLLHGAPAVDRLARAVRPSALLVAAALVAATAAFAWDHLDHGSYASSSTAAGLEAALTVAGFALLGPVLGLRAGLRHRHH